MLLVIQLELPLVTGSVGFEPVLKQLTPIPLVPSWNVSVTFPPPAGIGTPLVQLEDDHVGSMLDTWHPTESPPSAAVKFNVMLSELKGVPD